MRVFQINTVYNTGSTGRIAAQLKHAIESQGGECMVAFGRGAEEKEENTYKITPKWNVYIHALLTRITDRTAFYSTGYTHKLCQEIACFQPDVIQLHNLHGYYLNIGVLFEFLRKYHKPVVWTLHDCWAFTGHCAYFDYIQCDKWEYGCSNCPNRKEYPKSWKDHSNKNYLKKKELFTSLENMTIVVPSEWLKDRVERSFLRQFPIKVVYNGIDLSCFQRDIASNVIRERLEIGKKIVILGVASVWSIRKGLKLFEELADRLPDKYQIVLIGLSKKQIKETNKKIFGIERINRKEELAQFYAMSDIFINASTEETFGLTTVEAIACGTYTIVLEDTACAEIASLCGGRIVKRDSIAIENAIYEYDASQKVELIHPELFSEETYVCKMMQLYKGKL